MNVVGLNFDQQQRAVREAGVNLWGQGGLPLGYADGTAFEIDG